LLGLLARVPWRSLGVRWVLVFGGLARRGVGGDVDLLVMPGPRIIEGMGPLWRIELAGLVAEELELDWGLVDVVDARDAPCPVVFDAWRHGVMVYEEEPGMARDWLLVRVSICSDYELAVKRLGVEQAALGAARRRWPR